MKERLFTTALWLPQSRSEVFAYFAEAQHLGDITPPWLRFEILTPAPIVLCRGAVIDYRIVAHGIPLRWRTEIVEWDPPAEFVDVQIRGPYTSWRHVHTFEARDGGTLCRDQVRYRPRGGALIDWLFVRRDIEEIFRYRQERLLERFGSMETRVERAARR
jgi:ligand-binding SRPBCC domain-containing protein